MFNFDARKLEHSEATCAPQVLEGNYDEEST